MIGENSVDLMSSKKNTKHSTASISYYQFWKKIFHTCDCSKKDWQEINQYANGGSLWVMG